MPCVSLTEQALLVLTLTTGVLWQAPYSHSVWAESEVNRSEGKWESSDSLVPPKVHSVIAVAAPKGQEAHIITAVTSVCVCVCVCVCVYVCVVLWGFHYGVYKVMEQDNMLTDKKSQNDYLNIS